MAKKKKPEDEEKRKMSLVNNGTNIACLAMLYLGYTTFRNFYAIFYPTFPEGIQTLDNLIRPGTPLTLDIFVSNEKQPTNTAVKKAQHTYDFVYDDQAAVRKTFEHPIKVNLTRISKMKNSYVHAFVSLAGKDGSRQVIQRGSGTLVKYITPPEYRPKFDLMSGNICPEQREATYGEDEKLARGIPFVQVRLVHDDLAYPHGYMQPIKDHTGRHWYVPQVFVDESWMTDDQLVKFNESDNTFTAEITFDLMSGGRWRFQNHMMRSLKSNAEIFGEDSEEMLQFRDLVANTNTVLLMATFVVSFLHTIFEFLAFKHDVAFWRSTDADTLNKYISVRSIFLNIFCEIVICFYLYDQGSNLLLVLLQAASLIIEVWKITQAMTVHLGLAFGFIPYPEFRTRGKKKVSDTDKIAIFYLSGFLLPVCTAYGVYSLYKDCHYSWYSYYLQTAATLVYSLGLILMTPQLFMNYKNKSVAFLPWKRFVYRALNTFIDDLFAFIIKMPTMHRISVFRDDAVFFIYLYQRWIYPTDMGREYDEDEPEEDAGAGGPAGADGDAEPKKEK
jgi:hypothetical protein